MKDIFSLSFGSNISWFCANDTYLLNFPNKNSLHQIRPLRLSLALPAQWVRRLYPCCIWSISKWLSVYNSEIHGNMLEELVFLHQNFVSADLATGCHIPAASLVSCRLCSLRMIGPLWPRKTSYNWHSNWGAIGCRQGYFFGLCRQPHQCKCRQSFSFKSGTNYGGMEEGLSTYKK